MSVPHKAACQEYHQYWSLPAQPALWTQTEYNMYPFRKYRHPFWEEPARYHRRIPANRHLLHRLSFPKYTEEHSSRVPRMFPAYIVKDYCLLLSLPLSLPRVWSTPLIYCYPQHLQILLRQNRFHPLLPDSQLSVLQTVQANRPENESGLK